MLAMAMIAAREAGEIALCGLELISAIKTGLATETQRAQRSAQGNFILSL
jgi:hypothetical protein